MSYHIAHWCDCAVSCDYTSHYIGRWMAVPGHEMLPEACVVLPHTTCRIVLSRHHAITKGCRGSLYPVLTSPPLVANRQYTYCGTREWLVTKVLTFLNSHSETSLFYERTPPHVSHVLLAGQIDGRALVLAESGFARGANGEQTQQ